MSGAQGPSEGSPGAGASGDTVACNRLLRADNHSGSFRRQKLRQTPGKQAAVHDSKFRGRLQANQPSLLPAPRKETIEMRSPRSIVTGLLAGVLASLLFAG